ncbi:hypothetical protein [Paracoccus solventivorans]|uniref:hypothetical protein n=1 Tax=Paracoccus solventivorans TaxID=53463 RepID=UPI00116063C6|nr:hypothetical protein [Paracoccus solventivorans]
MADRTTFNGASSPMPTGLQFLDQYADRIGQLFDASVLQLTGIGGSPDMVTAMLDPALSGGLISGMKFTLTWSGTNTGPMTLAINGGPASPILTAAGSTMTQGAAQEGARALLEYTGGAFRILSASGDAGGRAASHYWQFTSSGTWSKPTGLPDDTMVTVELWGGGGGGGGWRLPCWRGRWWWIHARAIPDHRSA